MLENNSKIKSTKDVNSVLPQYRTLLWQYRAKLYYIEKV
jgi:hypothetical protein